MQSLRVTPLVLGLSVLAVAGACSSSGSTGTGGTTSTGTSSTTATTATTSTTATTATTTTTTVTATASTGTGMAPDLSCLGMPLPTTANPMVKVSGDTFTVGLSGQTPVTGVPIKAFANGNATSLAMTTSDSSGKFSLTLTTGGTPIDGYLIGQDNGMGQAYLDTYLFPPYPLAKDQGSASILLASQGTLSTLGLITSQTQMSTNAFVAVVVSDCSNTPIVGATISTSPSGTICYHQSGANFSCGSGSTGSDGIAFVFNVPPGNTMVSATYNGMNLRSHSVNAHPNAITTTAILP